MRFLYILILTLLTFTLNAQIPTSGNVLWLKADAAVYNDAAATVLAANGETAAQWNDQSGNTAHAICTPTGSRPTYVTNVLNGKPVLRFTNHYLQTSNIDLSATDKTDMYIVYKSVAPNNNWEIVAEHGPDYNNFIGFNLLENTQGLTYNGMFAGLSGGGYNYKDYPFKANEFKIVNTSFDKAAAANAKVNFRINAKDITLFDQPSAAGSGNFANYPLYIGNRGNAVGSYPLTGDIAEIILYNRKLSPAEKATIESYLNTKYNIICNVTTPQPGSGNCLQMGNFGAYAMDDADIDFGGNDFTIEFWTLKRALTSNVFNCQVVNKWNSGNVPGSNEWAIATSSDGFNNIPSFNIESGTTIYKADATSSLSINKWYHIAAVREGNVLKIYVNGILEGTTTMPPGTIINNVAARTFMAMGYIAEAPYYSNNSNLDELRIWNAALSQTTIRDWMCKKESAIHPNHAALTRYYRFDEPNGTVFGNQVNNCVTEAYSSGGIITTSGAPIGDNSVYNYTANTGAANINFGTVSDNLAVTMNAGTSAGIHLYAVNELPNNQNYPGVPGNNKYAGVFVVNGDAAAAYNATYNYTNNTAVNVSLEPNLKLFKRTDNAALVWSEANNQVLNTGLKTIVTAGQNTEYVLANAVTPVAPVCYGTFIANDLLNVTNSTDSYSLLDNNVDNFTYEFWANPAQPLGPGSTSGDRYIIFPAQTNSVGRTGIGIGVAVGTDGIRVYGHTAGYLAVQLGYNYSFTGWTHIAVVYNAQVPSIYINGLLVTTGTSNGTARACDLYMQSNLYSQYIGSTTDFRLWNYARSGSEINSGMNTAPAENAPGLQSLILFNNLFNGSGQLIKNTCSNLPSLSLDKITAGTDITPAFSCTGSNFQSLITPTCAARFNGTGRVDVTNSLGAFPAKGTIEFWLNQPVYTNYQIPISTTLYGTTDVEGILFQTYANGDIIVEFGGPGNVVDYTSYGELLLPGKNYHIAVTWDAIAKNYKGYLNGKLKFVKSFVTANFPTSLPRLTMGAGYNAGRYLDGTLDEVRYWNVERTQSQLISSASAITGTETGLQAYYHFNDNNLNGNGLTVLNKATATGASLNGTTVDNIKFPCSLNPPTCGIKMNGSGDNIQVPDNAVLSLNDFTLSAWVKTTDASGTFTSIIAKSAPGGQANYILYKDPNNKAEVRFTANPFVPGGIHVAGTTNINDGEWHFIAGTFDNAADELKIYVDGVLEGTLTTTHLPQTSSLPVSIGSHGSTNFWNGTIDEVSIWNIARTQADIQNCMTTNVVGNEPGLVAYYNFNDNNRSGQNKNITNFCTTTGASLNGLTYGTALTPVFDCAPPPFITPECNFVTIASGDYITVPDNAVLSISSSFTIAAYVKTTDASGQYKTILAKGIDGNNQNYVMYINPTGRVEVDFQRIPVIPGGAQSVVSTSLVNDGNWHYVVGTFDDVADELKIYIDGLLENTLSTSFVPLTGSFPLYMGSGAGSGNYNGSTDEVSIWNRALSATEVTSLIGQSLTGNETGLVAYYNFNDNHSNGQLQAVSNLCSATGSALNGITTGSAVIPEFTCSDISIPDPACAMLFNGNGDKALLGGTYNNNAFAGITQNFTVEIKVKPLVQKGNSSGAQYDGVYSGQKFAIFPDNGSDLYGPGNAGTGMSIGTNGIAIYEHSANYIPARIIHNRIIDDWIHVTLVYRNGAPSLYENGALISSTGASGYIVHPSALVSGFYGDYGGYISEIRVWDKSLSGTEVRNNLNVALTGSEANLVTLYRFDNTGADGNNKTINSYGSIGAITANKLVTGGSDKTPMFTCAVNVYANNNLTGAGHMMGSGNLLGSQPNYTELGNWGAMPNAGTISFWSYYATAAQGVPIPGQHLFSTSKWNADIDSWKGIRVITNATGGLDLVVGDNNSTGAGNSNTFTITTVNQELKWHHLAITWNQVAGNITVYLDGIQKLIASNNKWPATLGHVKAGTGYGTTSSTNFSGYLDELGYWNRQLTMVELRERMAAKITAADAFYGNLQHYYRFDDDDASGFIQDYKGTRHGIKYFGKNTYWSGTPLGDVSNYSFAGNSSAASVACISPGTDRITATLSNGNADGIIVYGNNDYPNTLLFVTDTIGNNNRYLGVHVINGDAAAAYNLVYDYTGNPTVTPTVEPMVKLFSRSQYYLLNTWGMANASLNTTANTLTVTGQGTQYILGKNLIVIPLRWLTFTATLNNSRQTLLNWKVSQESSVKHYTIEWSADGLNWAAIEVVNYNVHARGDYKAIHLQPEAGYNYYRIRQTDADGRFTYSGTQLVRLYDKIALSVYPNPANDIVYIVGWKEISKVSLFDMNGRTLTGWANSKPSISTSKLSNGTYVLKAMLISGEIIDLKIVVAR